MKRRSFFATIAAMFVAPKMLSKPKFEEIQKNVWEQNGYGLNTVQKYPEYFGSGRMEFDDHHILIYSNWAYPKIGDILRVDKVDFAYILNVYKRWEPGPNGYVCNEFNYVCQPPKIKMLFGKYPMIKIDGKWVLWKNVKGKSYDINFTVHASAWREGGVSMAKTKPTKGGKKGKGVMC